MESQALQIFPPSLQQEIMWEDTHRSNSVYPVNQIAWKIKCENESIIQQTFSSISICIEQLQVSIEEREERKGPFQILTGNPRFKYQCDAIDWKNNDLTTFTSNLLSLIRFECIHESNLITGHFQISSDTFLIHITAPAIIADICSLSWLLNTWVNQMRPENVAKKFSYEGLQYLDYSEWQRNNIRRFQSGVNVDPDELLPIECFKAKYGAKRSQCDFSFPEFPESLKHQVIRAKGEALMFYAWYNLISKLSQSPQCSLNYNCTGRKLNDLKNIFGLVEKTVPFVSKKSSADTSDIIDEIEEFLLSANQSIENFGGGLNWNLKSVGHSFSYFDLREYNLLDEKPFYLRQEVNSTGLQLTCIRYQNKMDFSIQFNPERYDENTIERLAVSLKSILISLIDYDSGDFIIAPIEAELLLIEGCLADHSRQMEKTDTVIDLIGQAAKALPNKHSIVDHNRQISYRALWNNSVRLGQLLIKKYHLQNGDVVALDLKRSTELVLGILSILQAGAVYLLMDARWPNERKEFVLKDSEAKLVIDNEFFQSIDLAEFEIDTRELLASPSKIDNKQNAYLIYTSGTTGEPKGVFIRHESLANYTKWISEEFRINSSDNTLLFSSLAFDLSYTSFWTALASGATVFLHEDEAFLNPIQVVQDLGKKSITYIKLTPTHFSMLVAAVISANIKLGALRLVILGGEKLSKNDIEKFWSIYPDVKFVNHYGPTESTVGCMVFPFDTRSGNSIEFGNIIGKPIANNRVYIANEKGACAMGEWGEIWIAGRSVASGYWKRPELSREKFPANPFSGKKELEHIYRTGDRGRLLHNGLVQFGGRLDNQLKINGFRVEPGEIEYHLLKITQAEQALVTVLEYKQVLRLVAFIRTNDSINEDQIKSKLRQYLPLQCVPDEIVAFEHFPTKGHGKIDQNALHQLIISRWESASKLNVQSEDRSAIIRSVWCEVLNLKTNNANDNFFEVGGDSIKAIRMMALLSQKGYDLDINVLFREQTIEKIEPYLVRKESQAEQGLVTGSYKLTPIQSRLFEEGVDQEKFVQIVMLDLEKRIELSQLDRIADKIMRHHDGLRLKVDTESRSGFIAEMEGSYFLREFSFEKDGAFEKEYLNILKELRTYISINKGPLVSIGLCQHSVSTVCFVVHHLVVDAISWRILVEDFFTLLQNEINEVKKALPAKTDSYARWSNFLYEYSDTPALTSEINYWQNVISTSRTYFHSSQQINNHEERKTLRLELPKSETRLLSTTCNKPFNTETNDLITSAVCLAVRAASGADDVFICLEGHGRERLIGKVDISRTVGWFSTLYPFSIDFPENQDLANTIIEVKEQLRRIPFKGIGYGILKYSHNSSLNLAPDPEVRLNYFGEISNAEDGTSFRLRERTTLHDTSLSTFPLDIIARIVEEQLYIEIIYAPSIVRSDFANNLVVALESSLTQIIAACSKNTNLLKTPSDFDYKGLSMQELENLFN